MEPNGSIADQEIVKLVQLGVEAAVERKVKDFKTWLGAMMLKALAWAALGAAVLFVGWITVRGHP